MDNTLIQLIFLNDTILLSKKEYKSWRNIQEEYSDYKTSLSPMSVKEVIHYFIDDYGNDDKEWPFTKEEIIIFSDSSINELFEKNNWIKTIINKIRERKYKKIIEANLLKNKSKK